MAGTADVVVIGGGVMGASTAYHLASRGARVALLEAAEFLGTGSTAVNAGGFRHQFSSAVNIELSKLSIAMLERFEEELGQPLRLDFCGYLFLLDREEDVRAFERNVALQRAHGIATEWLAPDEIARRIPAFDLEGIVAGTFHRRDGLVDPHAILQGYAAGARRAGAELRTASPVVGATVRGGRVVSVRTPAGEVGADAFVLATGAWSGEVGRWFGVEVPVQPVRRQIAVTGPIAGVGRDVPFVIDFSRALYFHHEGDGLLTGMSNRDEPPGFDTSVDEGWRERHLEAAMRRLPALGDAEVRAEWAGLYEVTPDDQPILGPVAGVAGLHACTGFSGHGLMHAPAAGLLLAEEILDGGAHSIDIAPLRWRAFDAAGEYNVV